MRLEESGDFSVERSPTASLEFLADTESLPHCLPGEVHSVEPREVGGVTAEVTASAGGASEDVRVRLYVEETDAEAGRVVYSGHGLGSRVKVDLEGEFTLSENGDGTDIAWRGAADIGGLLSSLNRGPAESVIRGKLHETAENVRLELDAAAD
jgi:carbon monoxide dehydrogenase subunit G